MRGRASALFVSRRSSWVLRSSNRVFGATNGTVAVAVHGVRLVDWSQSGVLDRARRNLVSTSRKHDRALVGGMTPL